MAVKAAIETADVGALRRALTQDPTRANTEIVWGEKCELRTHPLHYVSDMIFAGTLDRTKAGPLVDALIAAGANVNFEQPGHGESPLIGAASLFAEDVGLQLLDAGAEPDHRGLFRETALHWAAHLALDRLVSALIARGASVNLRDERYNGTPLSWAVHGWSERPPDGRGRHCEVVARLVAAGAEVDPEILRRPEIQRDAAMRAALEGNLDP
jgi:hypothetical protein